MKKAYNSKQESITPYYNICIVDTSNIFAIGLKNSIEKSLIKTAKSFVFIHKTIDEINPVDITPIDLLLIDYNDLFLPQFNVFFSKVKKKNPDLKLIISSNDLLHIDFIKLYSYNINGLFSKSLSIKSFNTYFKRVLEQSIYIDHKSIGDVINQEKNQKIKFYYKSVSLQNLELIQQRYNYLTPHFVDKDALSSLIP
jgi:DNA-binding NarL/FixJ family response regulator